MNPTSTYWTIESFNDTLAENIVLETKECKKRQEFYEIPLPEILYKHPYKCHTRARFINDVKRPADLSIRFSLTFEDLSEVPADSKSHIEISCDRKKNAIERTDEKIEVRSYWFNCTSYQNKGRKFRLIVELFHERSGKVAVRYSSKPFLIRAKRPIAKPGSRKRKECDDVSSSAERPTKRQKTTKAATPKEEQKPIVVAAEPVVQEPTPAVQNTSAPLVEINIDCPPPHQTFMEKKRPPVIQVAQQPYAFLNSLAAVSDQQFVPTSFEYEKNVDYWNNLFAQQGVASATTDDGCGGVEAFAFATPRQSSKPQQSEAFQMFDNLLSDAEPADPAFTDLFAFPSSEENFF